MPQWRFFRVASKDPCLSLTTGIDAMEFRFARDTPGTCEGVHQFAYGCLELADFLKSVEWAAFHPSYI